MCYRVSKYTRYTNAIKRARKGDELSAFCHRFSPFGRMKPNSFRSSSLAIRKGPDRKTGILVAGRVSWSKMGVYGILCTSSSTDHLVFNFCMPRKKLRKSHKTSSWFFGQAPAKGKAPLWNVTITEVKVDVGGRFR